MACWNCWMLRAVPSLSRRFQACCPCKYASCARAFTRGELERRCSDCGGNWSRICTAIASQFTLDFQNVADVAVIAVSPDVCLVACLNQPGSHANALPLSAHATFQQVIRI